MTAYDLIRAVGNRQMGVLRRAESVVPDLRDDQHLPGRKVLW